jgi:hypothetical protein
MDDREPSEDFKPGEIDEFVRTIYRDCRGVDVPPMADDMTPMERVVVAEHERRQAVQRAEQAEDRLRAVSGEYARLRERADDTEAARARWQKRGEEAEEHVAERDALKAATDRVRAIPRVPQASDIDPDVNRIYRQGWESVIDAIDRALDHPTDTTGETHA